MDDENLLDSLASKIASRMKSDSRYRSTTGYSRSRRDSRRRSWRSRSRSRGCSRGPSCAECYPRGYSRGRYSRSRRSRSNSYTRDDERDYDRRTRSRSGPRQRDNYRRNHRSRSGSKNNNYQKSPSYEGEKRGSDNIDTIKKKGEGENAKMAADASGKEEEESSLSLTLPDDIRTVLGEKAPEVGFAGLSVLPSLTAAWQQIAKKGLLKSDKEKIITDFDGCKFDNLSAPILNDEFSTMLLDSALKRDYHFYSYQVSLVTSLKAVGNMLTQILSDALLKESMATPLKALWDASKLILDVVKSLTVARRVFIINSVTDKYKKMLEKSEPNMFLFGDNLADKFKHANAMEKLGDQVFTSSKAKNWKGLFRSSPNRFREKQRPRGSTGNIKKYKGRHNQNKGYWETPKNHQRPNSGGSGKKALEK